MSLVVPPGYANASIILTGVNGTSPYVTTIGVETSGYGGDYVAAANNVMAGFITAFDSILSDELSVNRVSLFVGSDGPSGSVDSDLPPSVGNRSTATPPTAMSLIARKVTNDLGRRGRGRMFIPGVFSELDVAENGAIEPGSRSSLQGALDLFYEWLAIGDPAEPMPPVLFHSEGSSSTLPTPIQSLQLGQLVGWIRGRIR